jgi:tryptophan-rich sensory protein
MDTRRSQIILSIVNLFGFFGTVVVNGLATALPINNKTTGELSNQYPNLFVPAGLTFSIWGLIYILLAIFAIYSVIIATKKDATGSFINKIGILFFLSCIANMAWIFAWHYEIVPLSLVIMLLLLGLLIAIYMRLGIGKKGSAKKEQYLVHLPFSVYLGWITIATIANVTALLVDVDWNRFGLGEQFWAVVVIVVGIAITLSVLFRRQDIYYCLVVDWALLGILIKRLASSIPAQSVIIITIIGLVLITAGILVQVVRKKVYSAGTA